MTNPDSVTPSPDALVEALTTVMDPELGDNVVALGMVGTTKVEGGVATVELALTTSSCPLRAQLRDDIETALSRLDGVESVQVKTVEMDAAQRSAVMERARWKARERAVPTDIPDHARVLAIASGKGGVGKSSVTVNLAAALARRGHTVGVLDADIWGFSVPRMLGISSPIDVSDGKMRPVERSLGDGLLKVISMGFLSEENEAIMWRGLMLNRAVQHFLEDVSWGDLDYLLIDMPPGTGDVQMGLARMLPRSEMIIVTTPTLAAQNVAARAADMARRGHLRVAGVVENMSPFTDETGRIQALFGEGGGRRLAVDIGAPLLGSIPLDPLVAAAGDGGEPLAQEDGRAGLAFDQLATTILTALPAALEMAGCTARVLAQVESLSRQSDGDPGESQTPTPSAEVPVSPT